MRCFSQKLGMRIRKKRRDRATLAVYALLVIAIALAGFSQYQIFTITGALANVKAAAANPGQSSLQEAVSAAIPTGVPKVYGEELGISFSDPVDGMNALLKYEDLPLTDEQLSRYVNVGMRISCEYCCGARTLVFSDGRRACGCAHSYAMRGLAKYLLVNHGDEYADEQILKELADWKAVFFPKQTIEKVLTMMARSGEIDASVLNELPSMVGGC